ncbi:MAG: helix-turn-helix domain-containing protein [Acidimicrobiia bacterium]
MLGNSVWARVVGVDRRTVIEGVEFDEAAEVVVVAVRRRRPGKQRCGLCGRVAGGYDQGGGRRRWRALDLGVVRVELEADAPRVSCRVHGVVVAEVPWERHGAGHTRAFDDTVAWLVTQASKSATSELLRVSWRTVGSIVDRVVADLDRHIDRFDHWPAQPERVRHLTK